jgi:hypothetical protein
MKSPTILWYCRIAWIGIVANILLASFGFLSPNTLLALLGIEPAVPSLWPQFACMLLILLSLFYAAAAHDPYRYRANAWIAIGARLAGVAFFFAHSGNYRVFGLFDASFAVPQAILLSTAPTTPSDR